MAAERRDPHEAGAPVKLLPTAGPTSEPTTPGCCWRGSRPGWARPGRFSPKVLAGRASAIMLDYTQQGVAVRTMVDGVWIPPRSQAARARRPRPGIAQAALRPESPRTARAGRQGPSPPSTSRPATRRSSPRRERRRRAGAAPVRGEEDPLQDARRAGHEDQAARATPGSARTRNRAWCCSRPRPAAGCAARWTWRCTTCDRFTREFVAVEEESIPIMPVENVPVTTYKAAEGQSPADVLPQPLPHRAERGGRPRSGQRRDGRHVVRRRSPRTSRLMISTVRAKDSAEALLRVLALGVPPAEFAKADHGGGQPAVGAQAVRGLQRGLRAAAADAPAVGHSRRPRPGVLPAAAAEPRAAEGAVPGLRRRSATWAAPPFSRCWRSATRSARRWPPERSSTCCVRPPAKTA